MCKNAQSQQPAATLFFSPSLVPGDSCVQGVILFPSTPHQNGESGGPMACWWNQETGEEEACRDACSPTSGTAGDTREDSHSPPFPLLPRAEVGGKWNGALWDVRGLNNPLHAAITETASNEELPVGSCFIQS